MRNALDRRASVILLGALTGAGCTAPRAQHSFRADPPLKIVVFPGISNVGSTTHGLTRALEEAFPEADVDLRIWGVPFLNLQNLWAHERNLETARSIAREIADFRESNPDSMIHLVGYSGGGAMAVFVVEALPDSVQIDRLVLLAPALAPDYPLTSNVMPKVRDFAITFTSTRDRTISWGTNLFGTMDEKQTYSAGFAGFDERPARMIHKPWNTTMRNFGHTGGHLGYLSGTWSREYVVPALDPDVTMREWIARHPDGPS